MDVIRRSCGIRQSPQRVSEQTKVALTLSEKLKKTSIIFVLTQYITRNSETYYIIGGVVHSIMHAKLLE